MNAGENRSFFYRLFRELLRLIVYSQYKIEVLGAENIPVKGAALFISNHISYADPFLVSAPMPQTIRFLMWRAIFDWKPTAWFFSYLGMIPIDANDDRRRLLGSLKEARHALEQGVMVGLFPEGAISRLAVIMGFRKGLEHIVKGTNAPIIPVHIDRMWGSILSFYGGKFIFKRPQISRLPITVTYGAALAPHADVHQVRQAITNLSAVAFARRLVGKKPLHEIFIDVARCSWNAPCFVDTKGHTLFTRGQLASAAVILADVFEKRFEGERAVGVAIPPSAESALCTLALLFAGKVPVPFDRDMPEALFERKRDAAGVKKWVGVEDIPDAIGESSSEFALRFMPGPVTTASLTDTVSVFLTEKEGAVSITHAQALANVLGLQEALSLDRQDTVIAHVKASDPMALIPGFWWPLLQGARIESGPPSAELPEGSINIRSKFTLVKTEQGAPTLNDAPFLRVFARAEVAGIGILNSPDAKDGAEVQIGGADGTVGRCLPGISARIIDPKTGTGAQPAVAGRLWLKGPAVAGKTDADGWFDTGENASRDENGFIRL